MQPKQGMVNKKLIFILIALGFIKNTNAQTGIGTTAPVNKLHIEATTADPATSGATANGNLRLSGSGATHVLDFGLSSTSTFSWLQARSKSAYGTYYNLVLNPNGGNVGIGTSSPTAKLNIAGGGIRIFNGFGNSTSRPAVNTSSIGNYEIRGVGAITGSTQADGGDDGFLRLSAGGGTNSNAQTSIDLSGYSGVSDMNNNIVMRTAGTERLRIGIDGKVGLGISTPLVALHIQNGNVFSGSDDPSTNTIPSFYVYNTNNSSTSAHAISLVRTAGTGSGKPYYALDVNGAFGYSMGINNPTDQIIINTSWNFNTVSSNNAIIINRTGQVRVAIPEKGGVYNTDFPSGWGGGLATYDICAASIYASNFVSRSDRRLKNTIINIDSSVVSKFLNLRPVTFYWNQDKPRDPNLQYGLIAQEVESLFPEMVLTATDSMQTKSVNYQALHALSLKVIQAQQAEIDALKKKQADMEQRLLKLEAKLNP
jgi:hypothetical protein